MPGGNRIRYSARVEPLADGAVEASFVVQQGRKAAVLRLLVSSGGDEVSGGSAVFPAAALMRTTAELAAIVPVRVLSMRECRSIGLYGDGAGAIADAFVRFSEGRRGDGAGVAPARAPESPLDRRYGVGAETVGCLAGIDSALPVDKGAPTSGATPSGHLFYPDRLDGYVKDWVARLRPHVQGPAGLWFLPPDAWTDDVSAWLSAFGETGERRRQACRLQCGLAPVLAAEPAIARAIDAGAPFEPELLGVARGWLPEALRGRLDLARLRRLRGVDFAGMARMASLLGFAARSPLGLLPEPGQAPRELSWLVGGTVEALDRMGLDLDPFLADPLPGWLRSRDPTRPPADRYERLHTVASGALDMASSLARDLVRPLMADWLVGGAPLDRRAFERLAGRFLFEGLPVARVAEASRRWHDDLERLRDAADTGIPDMRWPELFEPFECGNGASVACLVTARELDDEGRRGPDAETGMDGLGHCVGGYAEDCYTGDVHVASVRAGGRRLSTVEFAIRGRDGRPAVVQHRGMRNGDPEPLAVEAVAELMSAVGRGEVSLNPAALETRDGPEPGPVTPEVALRRMHAAWRPHLPRGGDDPIALEACLAEILRGDLRREAA